MLNVMGKALLLASSLSPLILGLAIKQLLNAALGWVAILTVCCLLSVGGCVHLVRRAPSRSAHFPLHIRKFVRRDHEVSALLVAYVLPFLLTDTSWPITIYVVLMLALALYYGGGYHFNPVMALLRYHFYTIETDSSANHLLISRVQLHPRLPSVSVVRFTSEVSVLAGDPHE